MTTAKLLRDTFLIGAACYMGYFAQTHDVNPVTVYKSMSVPAQFAEARQNLTSESFWFSLALVVGYLLLQVVLSAVVPGYMHKGTPLSDGSLVTYKINGFRLLFVVVLLFSAGVHFEIFKATIIYDNFLGIFIWANIIATALASYLYVKGRSEGAKMHGFLHDFWGGTQLMPFIGNINIKFFWYRPSMMLWVLINLSMLAKHLELQAGQGPSTAILLYTVFTTLYVVDYFWVEEKMTSTWDIIAEHFGFMLVWGDFVFIPFYFSLQTWYLVANSPVLSQNYTLLCIVCFLIGYAIFRGCNNQKDLFKMEGMKAVIWGEPVEAVNGKLLVSGFWGWARHLNYTGDLILAMSYGLPCMFNFTKGAWLGYLYFLYLLILTVDRERRDNDRCAQKYGKMWTEYTGRVPYRMVPFIY